MPTGVEMLLKASGIDFKKITEDFTKLTDGVTKVLESIEGKLTGIADRQTRLENRMEEIWKANQLALKMCSQVQLVPVQPQAAQNPPSLPQEEQQPNQVQPQ